MVNYQLIKRIIELEDFVVPTLFKPVQFNIIKKLNFGKKLNENEKRYLRGKMKTKLAVLEKLGDKENKDQSDYIAFLNNLNSYYITGLEALKHNGFGWYFQPKVIEVINTKIQGKLIIANKTIKLIRIKSIKNKKFTVDKKTAIKYATNEQIIKDVKITKNLYTKSVWIMMLSRYGKLFIKNYTKFKSFLQKAITIDYTKYGV